MDFLQNISSIPFNLCILLARGRWCKAGRGIISFSLMKKVLRFEGNVLRSDICGL